MALLYGRAVCSTTPTDGFWLGQMSGGYTIELAHPRSEFLIVNSTTPIIFSPDHLTGPPLARALSLAPAPPRPLVLSLSLARSVCLSVSLYCSLLCLPL